MVQSSTVMPTREEALPGRPEGLEIDRLHVHSKQPLKGPYPRGLSRAVFAMGCFWGVERLYWKKRGVWVTAVGYCGGYTPNPTYEEVCTGATGHAEAVLVVYDPQVVSYTELVKMFWENHDPTVGMRQGEDVGTQYRSAIYYFTSKQKQIAEWSMGVYADLLKAAGEGPITTEITPHEIFYFAESYHQGYLIKKPDGYCGLRGTSVCFPNEDLPRFLNNASD